MQDFFPLRPKGAQGGYPFFEFFSSSQKVIFLAYVQMFWDHQSDRFSCNLQFTYWEGCGGWPWKKGLYGNVFEFILTYVCSDNIDVKGSEMPGKLS